MQNQKLDKGFLESEDQSGFTSVRYMDDCGKTRTVAPEQDDGKRRQVKPFPCSHTLLITQRQIQKYNRDTKKDTNIAVRYIAVRPKTFTNKDTRTKTSTNTKNYIIWLFSH